MSTKNEIKTQLDALIGEERKLFALLKDENQLVEFCTQYQSWYTKSLKIVAALIHDRYDEFVSYYRVDGKRKLLTELTYTIQDYVNGVSASTRFSGEPNWDILDTTRAKLFNQCRIIESIRHRIDSVLRDVTGALFSDIQDRELEAANKLKKINLRASGSLAGVILERHLQKVAESNNIKIKSKNPTLSELNDPLKASDIYDITVWRKIQYLSDIRNICSHNKSIEPSQDQIEELLNETNKIIKTII